MKCFVILAVVGILLCGVDVKSPVAIACSIDGVEYEVGDEIPSNDPCQTCTCTEHGQICSAIGCAVQNCRHGLQPRRKRNECCETCGCVVNRVAYDIGEKIPDNDPCTNCTCTENGQICTAIGCAVPNCRHGLQPRRKRNECCETCGCVVNRVAYDIGEKIPDNDPCTNCTCTENGQICTAIGCAPANCRRGLEPRHRINECCPSCKCVLRRRAYNIGEEIPHSDPCFSCTCTEDGLQCDRLRTSRCT